MGEPRFDEQDEEILAERVAALNAVEGPRVGDWIEFPGGQTRRISHLWPEGAQTSNGGSFHLGHGAVSFSGSLFTSVPLSSLTQTDRMRTGSVWFFHHNCMTAHNGVDANVSFRVFTCTEPAPGC